MRRRARSAAVECYCCHRPTDEPRKGLCPGCYHRRRRGHDVAGEACAICQLADPRMLRRRELRSCRVVLCANHDAVAGHRELELDELRAECA